MIKNRKKGHVLYLMLLTLLVSGCQSTAPRDGGPIGVVKRDMQRQTVAPDKPQTPPPAVSAALIPPVDLKQVEIPKQKREARFDINVTNVAAKDFLMGIVEGTPYNMVVHPEVSGNLSLSLKSVTIPEVLEVLRDVYGYEFQRNRSGFSALPVRLQSRIFQVNYLNIQREGSSQTKVSSGQVSESDSDNEDNDNNDNGSTTTSGTEINTRTVSNFWAELTQAMSAIVGNGNGRSVVITPQTGIIVVRAMPSELREVERYLEATENAIHRQVILEAKILEVELNDGYQAGINWSKMFTQGDNTFSFGQSGTPNMFENPGKEGVTIPTGGIEFTDFEGFGGFFGATVNTGSFMALIELLESQGNVQVLSSPRVSTLNNQKAVIKVGTDEFFVTDVSSTTTTGTATTTTPDITLTPFFSGIALDVTPQIDAHGRVTLHIHPSVSTVNDQQKVIEVGNETQNIPLARSTVRESDSVVYAQSGQLIVIGGLMQDNMGEDVVSTPVLGDLPLLGQLFRHTRQGAKKSELIIVMRPTVVDTPSVWGTSINDASQRFDKLNRGFHYGGHTSVFGNQAE
ncbi:MAG: pilus (MSHA type) biogenesis protein MshL [Chromatiales bacterium]|nr:pilus (MSHA type) biogenesis protein MshL [Chromatiales bacterium]